MPHPQPLFRLFLISVMVITGFLTACGIKGPPVPPRRYRPPAVSDLSYKIENESLELTWTVPYGTGQRKVDLAGCVVHRSMRPFSDPDCKKCPAPYEKVADVPVQRNGDNGKPVAALHYGENLVSGFDYAFRVTCYTNNDIFGDVSNIVSFKY